MPPSGFSPAPVEELQLRPGSSCFRDPGGSSEAGGFGVSGKAEAGHVHQAVCHGRGGERVATRGRQTPASRLQGLWARVNDCVHAWCCSARPGGGAAGGDGPPRGRRLSGPTPPPPPTRTEAGAGSGPHACSSSDWAVGSGRAAIVSSAPGAVQGSARSPPSAARGLGVCVRGPGGGRRPDDHRGPQGHQAGEQQPTAPPALRPSGWSTGGAVWRWGAWPCTQAV